MSERDDPMQGIGGKRELTARWVVSGTLTLTSAAHLGGALEGPAEMALLRDRASGLPTLAGSSLAGALRSHLADVQGGYGLDPHAVEHASTQVLFGASRAQDEGRQSPLVVHEARAARGGPSIEIRDGVAIDAGTGTAREHGKYDIELLPAGTTFPLEFELDIVAGRAGYDPDRSLAGERELLSLLVCALGGLEAPDAATFEDRDDRLPHSAGRAADGTLPSSAPIAIGARSARGLGRCRVSAWRARRFDLTTAGGWIALACDEPGTAEADGERIRDVIAEALGGLPLDEPIDRSRMTVLDVHLAFDRALLIGSPAEAAAPGDTRRAPDVAQLRSGGVPVLSGSSLAGAMRAHATRIARRLACGAGSALEHVEALFGSDRAEEAGGRGSHDRLRPSALRVAECEVLGATRQRAARIRVDRLTRGVVPGGLFEEEPVVGGVVNVRLELRHGGRIDPPVVHSTDAHDAASAVQPAVVWTDSPADPPALGLLLLTVRDLIDGLVPLGGTVAVGRGAIDPERSSATVRLEGGTAMDLRDPGEGSARFDEIVEALLADMWDRA